MHVAVVVVVGVGVVVAVVMAVVGVGVFVVAATGKNHVQCLFRIALLVLACGKRMRSDVSFKGASLQFHGPVCAQDRPSFMDRPFRRQ